MSADYDAAKDDDVLFDESKVEAIIDVSCEPKINQSIRLNVPFVVVCIIIIIIVISDMQFCACHIVANVR